MSEASTPSAVPPILEETLRRRQGLVLLAGARGSGIQDTVNHLLGLARDRTVAVLPKGTITQETDFVLWEGPVGVTDLKRLLTWSEEGRLVVIVQTATTAVSALRRLLSEDFGQGRSHVLWRFADQLLLMAGQMKVAGLSNQPVEAFEILLVTPGLREALESEDFVTLEAQVKGGEETSGSVSFNQSLLQLLLRRKIDIKTAFEATRDPVHLDQILKKVGI